jgi:preprotein translocase subunit SecB
MLPKDRQPSVKVLAIVPSVINFKRNAEKFENAEMGIKLEVRGGISEDRKNGSVTIFADIHHKEHQGPFGLTIEMLGVFEKTSEEPFDWEPFLAVNAPAIVFPYLRELVSDLSTRAGSTLILPTINTAAAAATGGTIEWPPKKKE